MMCSSNTTSTYCFQYRIDIQFLPWPSSKGGTSGHVSLWVTSLVSQTSFTFPLSMDKTSLSCMAGTCCLLPQLCPFIYVLCTILFFVNVTLLRALHEYCAFDLSPSIKILFFFQPLFLKLYPHFRYLHLLFLLLIAYLNLCGPTWFVFHSRG